MTETNHGYIYDIFVKEEQQRKGIGARLMEEAERYCRETGYHEMLLMVAVNNQPAQKLYTKKASKPNRRMC